MDDLDHPLLGHPGAIGRSGCGGGRPQSPPAGPWRGYFEPVQETPCCAGCDGLPPGWRGVMRASRLPAGVVFEEPEAHEIGALPEPRPVQLSGAIAEACGSAPRVFGTPVPCAQGPSATIVEALRWSVGRFGIGGSNLSAFVVASNLVMTAGHLKWYGPNADPRLVARGLLPLRVDELRVGQVSPDGRTALQGGGLRLGWDFVFDGERYGLQGWTELRNSDREPVDYSIWSVLGTQQNPLPVLPFVQLRTFFELGEWVYMMGHGSDASGVQREMEISRAKLRAGDAGEDGVPRIGTGPWFLEAWLNSVPACSGAPWLDGDGCAIGVNKEGYRGFRRGDEDLSDLEEGVNFIGDDINERKVSWASSMLWLMSESPTIRRLIGESSPRGLQCRPWLTNARTFEHLLFRDDEFGHLLTLRASRYTGIGDISILSWAQEDVTVLFRAPRPARHATLGGWTNDRGLAYVAYVSDEPQPAIGLVYTENGRTWTPVFVDLNALRGLAREVAGVGELSLEPRFLTAWYEARPEQAHIVVGDSQGNVFELISAGHGSWNARFVTSGADTSAQGSNCLVGGERSWGLGLILRMREGVLAHFRWERDRWRRRVNTRVPRGAVHVAVASVVLPAHAVGGVPEEFVFSCYEADGRDHLIQMGYDARGDLWHVIEGDIPGRAGSPPVGDVRPGRSLAAVVESVPIPGGGESASIVRLAYPTREPGLSTVAVARLDSRTRTWAADTVGVVAGAYLGVSHIGRSGNDRLCIVGGDGRLDWLVGYTPWTVRRYCLSDRTGMPRGWSYRPGHRPHPRES